MAPSRLQLVHFWSLILGTSLHLLNITTLISRLTHGFSNEKSCDIEKKTDSQAYT